MDNVNAQNSSKYKNKYILIYIYTHIFKNNFLSQSINYILLSKFLTLILS
jgi:hypothetical protein